jgi:hypothetical protein
MDDEGFYCDDCVTWHEDIDDCPLTLHTCPHCGQLSVTVEYGPAPDDPPTAACSECGWESPV